MNFSEYQKSAKETAIYPKNFNAEQLRDLFSLFTKVASIAEHIKKSIRDNNGVVDVGFIRFTLNETAKDVNNLFHGIENIDHKEHDNFFEYNALYPVLGLMGEVGEFVDSIYSGEPSGSDSIKELGDILWYLSANADELQVSLDDIAEQNIRKLLKRKALGLINGSGDDREEKA